MFDDMFNDAFGLIPMSGRRDPLYGRHGKNLMKTRRKRNRKFLWSADVDLPGFDERLEVKVELEDGYLTISAAKGLDKDEKDKEGRYIRQERYTGQCSRAFM